MTVWRPNNLLALFVKMFHDIETNRRGHHPIRARFHGCAGVGIDHDSSIRMLITERGEFIHRAAKIQRAGRVEIRHQDDFIRREYLRRLAHETYTSNHQGLCSMIAAETCHLQRVRHATACFFSEVLQVGVNVVMRHQYRALFFQQGARAPSAANAVAARPVQAPWPMPRSRN